MNKSMIEVDVALLKQVSTSNKEVLDKLSTSVEKLGDITTSVAKILAVHDERISRNEDKDELVAKQIEERRLILVDDLKTISERMEEIYTDLNGTIKHSEEQLIKKIDSIVIYNEEEKTKLDSRIVKLENWRWMLLGAGTLLGFILGKLPFLAVIFKSFFN